jgi:hypothetical protein
MPPHEFARLTRWQVEHLYLKPQRELMKTLQGNDDGGSSVTAETLEEGLPSKEVFVAHWASLYPEEPLSKWESDYDRLASEAAGPG